MAGLTSFARHDDVSQEGTVTGFRKHLLAISQSLRSDEVKHLCFLCTDILQHDLGRVEQAIDLFDSLREYGLLSAERPHLLSELLQIIRRPLLVEKYHLPQPTNQISGYRKLLYNLHANISDSHLREIIFMLRSKLTERQLEKATMLQIFRELENEQLLSPFNLTILEETFAQVYPALNQKIADYKETPDVGRPVAEESGNKEVVDSGMFSSQTASLIRDGPKGTDEDGALCGKLKPLSIEEVGSCESKMVYEDVQTAGSTQESNSYTMTSVKRGTCLIINNVNFKVAKLKKRDGSLVDEESASAVFKWLNFEVKIHRDCDRDTILSLINDAAAQDHSQEDALVCMIFSHGRNDCVVGVNGHKVTFQELKAPFTGSKCPSLVGKPKMFFIQACQFVENNAPVTIVSDSWFISDAVKTITIPSESDFLLGKSSVPHYLSFRDTKLGTWYIQSLCQHLIRLVPREEDLVSILTEVNKHVSEKSDPTGKKKQMPNIESSLRGKVFFPVPEAPPPQLPSTTS